MTTATTMSDSMTTAVEQAKQRRDAALAALDAAQGRLDALNRIAQGPPGDLDAWQARHDLPAARADRDRAQVVFDCTTRDLQHAEHTRQMRRDAEYAPRRRELVRGVVTPALRALAAAVGTVRRSDLEHQARGGGRGWELPFAEFVDELGEINGATIHERLARAADEPRPEPDEPRPGMKRVRVVKEFINSERLNDREHLGLTWLDARVADEAVKKGWAVPVA